MSGFDGEVHMVRTATGGHPEPPCDESWSDLDKLRWLAALVSSKTGLRVSVHPAEQRTKIRGRGRVEPGLYGVNVGFAATSGQSFHSAWTLLTGIDIGAEQAARRLASD